MYAHLADWLVECKGMERATAERDSHGAGGYVLCGCGFRGPTCDGRSAAVNAFFTGHNQHSLAQNPNLFSDMLHA